MLVVPAVDGDGIISAYACIDLIDVTATLADGEFVLTSTNEGARAVAVYAGGAINATGYPEILKFDTVVGADGEVNIPVVTEIAGDAAKIVEELTKLLNEVNDALAQINKYEDIIAGENGWINKFINQYIRKYRMARRNEYSVYTFFGEKSQPFHKIISYRLRRTISDIWFKICFTPPFFSSSYITAYPFLSTGKRSNSIPINISSLGAKL